ncbi:MAG: peptidylprolyl isomerase [Deltaproteobacteria bacterium]|nr:peptidylprolyl isomerase [Deltaproteobacteria bacterium]
MSEQGALRVVADTVVTIEYRATLTNGELVDSTERCGPVTYLHGNEQIFPALEQAVEGLVAGEERRLTLSPNESYGEHRSDLVRRMPRAQLPPELALEVGKRYTVRPPRGEPMIFRLTGIEGDDVLADFNNPAAGQGLDIWAKVVAVRAATAEEIRRGTLR